MHDVSYFFQIHTQAAKFLISQQKYLELLEAQELNAALVVLRSELAPLNNDSERLQLLSRCVISCPLMAFNCCTQRQLTRFVQSPHVCEWG